MLIVENDESLVDAVAAVVTGMGHETRIATEGQAGLQGLFEWKPDMIVLDITLPDMDGCTLLTRIRDVSDVPVLVLTVSGTDDDKVRGLESGADDCVTTPFSVRELAARINVQLRHGAAALDSEDAERYYRLGPLEIDWSGREVRSNNKIVDLSALEFHLLAAFVQRPGIALSNRELLAYAWGDMTGVGPERVKFAVLRLRQKLGWDESGPIEAVRGHGYRFRPTEPRAAPRS